MQEREARFKASVAIAEREAKAKEGHVEEGQEEENLYEEY